MDEKTRRGRVEASQGKSNRNDSSWAKRGGAARGERGSEKGEKGRRRTSRRNSDDEEQLRKPGRSSESGAIAEATWLGRVLFT